MIRSLSTALSALLLLAGMHAFAAAPDDKGSATPMTHTPKAMKAPSSETKTPSPPGTITHFDPGKLTPTKSDLPA
ncbi:MAG: hypothetical protein O3A51_08345, partial [Verrucomicrobia bacterium]|nr:hypothetical protein [Verrucomicrobiota bacterium]